MNETYESMGFWTANAIFIGIGMILFFPFIENIEWKWQYFRTYLGLFLVTATVSRIVFYKIEWRKQNE